MSDEINLILTKLKLVSEIEEEGSYICTKKNCKLLLDYITNLQDQVNALVNVKDKLLEENERLKNELVKIPRAKLEYELELENYKSRCEKAIEELFELKDMIYKPETREENFPIQRKISRIIINLEGKDE